MHWRRGEGLGGCTWGGWGWVHDERGDRCSEGVPWGVQRSHREGVERRAQSGCAGGGAEGVGWWWEGRRGQGAAAWGACMGVYQVAVHGWEGPVGVNHAEELVGLVLVGILRGRQGRWDGEGEGEGWKVGGSAGGGSK